ncbi:acid-sensing ion channel 2-like [Glandiceps talaboti]
MDTWANAPGVVNDRENVKDTPMWTVSGTKSNDRIVDMSTGDVKENRFSRFKRHHKEASFMMRERFDEFANDTTLHGMKYAVNSKYGCFRRVIWSMIVLGMISVFSVQTVRAFLRYTSYEISTVINMNYVTDMDFPAITICNYNQYRKSAVNTTGEKFLKLLYPTSGNESITKSIDWDLYNVSGINMTAIALDSAHRKEQMVEWCQWKLSEECGPMNFTQVITDFGVCYTFNDQTPPLKVWQSGTSSGLFLRLNVEQYEYTNNENTGAGFRILVHPQGQSPMVRQLGFAASPGYETLVSMRYTKLSSLPAPFPSKCSSQKLKYYDTYSRTACIAECLSDEVVKECGCRKVTQPGIVETCDPRGQVECVEPMLKNLSRLGKFCDCPTPCDQSVFETKVSSTYWPSDYILQQLEEEFNLTNAESFVRKNFLDLWFYFEELSFEEVDQVESYSSSSLQSDIGGFLGLFLGASLITVSEFLDFILVSFIKKYKIYHGR